MDNNDKTKIYKDLQNQKTGLYNAQSQNGELLKGNMQPAESSLIPGEKISLRNKEYNVLSTLSEGTGEAIVYLIRDSNSKDFALKLYYDYLQGAEEPNGIALERIKSLNDEDILKLYDFGVGADKFRGKNCYEISQYA